VTSLTRRSSFAGTRFRPGAAGTVPAPGRTAWQPFRLAVTEYSVGVVLLRTRRVGARPGPAAGRHFAAAADPRVAAAARTRIMTQ
jgi:hypothetical protein